MSSELIQTKTDAALATIQGLNSRVVSSINSTLSQLDRVLNKTNGLTQGQIISAAGGKLNDQLAFIAALHTAVNIAVPDSYSTVIATTSAVSVSA
jgi:hypothetical protein